MPTGWTQRHSNRQIRLAAWALLDWCFIVATPTALRWFHLIDKSVALYVLAVVQNQTVFLAFEQTCPTANDLDVEASGCCRPNQTNQIHVRRVKPCRQHVHVNQATCVTVLKSFDLCCAILLFVFTSQHFRINQIIEERILQHMRMVNATGKDQPAFAVGSKPNNFFNSLAHQFRIRCSNSQIALDKLTTSLLHVGQVDLLQATLTDDRRQIPLIHQHRNRNVVGNAIKDRTLPLVQIP